MVKLTMIPARPPVDPELKEDPLERAGLPWDREEEEILLSHLWRREPIEHIARMHLRSVAAITSRMNLLGVNEHGQPLGPGEHPQPRVYARPKVVPEPAPPPAPPPESQDVLGDGVDRLVQELLALHREGNDSVSAYRIAARLMNLQVQSGRK